MDRWKKLKLKCGPSALNFDLTINDEKFYPTEFSMDFPTRGPVKVTLGFYVRETDIEIENGEFLIKPQAFPGLTVEQLISFRDSCDKAIRDKYEDRIEFAKKYPNGLGEDDEEEGFPNEKRGPKLL